MMIITILSIQFTFIWMGLFTIYHFKAAYQRWGDCVIQR